MVSNPDAAIGLQVEMLTAQEINCPISLEAPVCPQITPCGHVFAFPSILAHLMNHGGDNLRKASPCPLCFQPIVARELRLVQIKVVTPPKVLFRTGLPLLQEPAGLNTDLEQLHLVPLLQRTLKAAVKNPQRNHMHGKSGL